MIRGEIGNRIKLLRESRDFTREELAQLLRHFNDKDRKYAIKLLTWMQEMHENK